MKRLWPLLLALSLYSCKDDDPDPVVQNIYLLGQNVPELDSFVRAVDVAGLRDAVAQSSLRTNANTYTVFAPDNAAFRALMKQLEVKDLKQIPNATLVDVLSTHIVRSTIFRTDLMPNNMVTTLNSQQLEVLMSGEDSVVSVRVVAPSVMPMRNQSTGPSWDVYATVKRPDLRASNGVIHMIDKVLMPKANIE